MAPVTAKRKSKIKVGQSVVLPIGRNRLRGRVVEDRGNLGVHGERILRIQGDQGDGVPPSEYEVPEGELELG